jgi:two-component system, response regulator PdtaR
VTASGCERFSPVEASYSTRPAGGSCASPQSPHDRRDPANVPKPGKIHASSISRAVVIPASLGLPQPARSISPDHNARSAVGVNHFFLAPFSLHSLTLGRNRMSGTPCILIVEDEPLVADGLRGVLEEIGLGTCHVAQSVGDAIRAAEQHKPLLIIMDLQLRGIGDGVDAAIAIHKHMNCPIIFTTADTSKSALQRMFEDKPSAILKKPFSVGVLKRAVLTSLRQALEQELDDMARAYPDLR